MTTVSLSGRLASLYPDDQWEGPCRLAEATNEADPNGRRVFAQNETADIIEDVEEMLGRGLSGALMADLLGRRPAGLEQRLRRAGRPELGRVFGRVG